MIPKRERIKSKIRLIIIITLRLRSVRQHYYLFKTLSTEETTAFTTVSTCSSVKS